MNNLYKFDTGVNESSGIILRSNYLFRKDKANAVVTKPISTIKLT